jgi:hypothetical protein
MDANATSRSPSPSASAAARYRRALETAAWACADFSHPVDARARIFGSPSSPERTPTTPLRTAVSLPAPAWASAVHSLATWASFALVALAGYLR